MQSIKSLGEPVSGKNVQDAGIVTKSSNLKCISVLGWGVLSTNSHYSSQLIVRAVVLASQNAGQQHSNFKIIKLFLAFFIPYGYYNDVFQSALNMVQIYFTI
jgi:hypothetical protein